MVAFVRRFATAEACRASLEQLRWLEGLRCSTKAWRVRQLWCQFAGRAYQNPVTARTTTCRGHLSEVNT